ncbi:MAG TPA: hypothetical protein VFS00_18405, partial [Polyangiaceae bacterium]|nr:hypothetical protein [Polyangiaceae bacterium]
MQRKVSSPPALRLAWRAAVGLLGALGALSSAACATVTVEGSPPPADPDGTAAGPGKAEACRALPPNENDPATLGGFERCGGGFTHRRARGVCPQPRTAACVPPPGVPTPGVCREDRDCSSEANGVKGRCVAGEAPGDPCGCSFSCAVDDDCSEGRVCLCDADGGRCVAGSCAVDDDCDRGLLCITTAQRCGGELFACQSPRDACASDLDCKGDRQCFLRDGRRVCERSASPESCGAGAET